MDSNIETNLLQTKVHTVIRHAFFKPKLRYGFVHLSKRKDNVKHGTIYFCIFAKKTKKQVCLFCGKKLS